MRRPHLGILESDLHSAATHCLKGVLEEGSQHSPLGLWEACDAEVKNMLGSSPKLPQHHKESQRGQPGWCSASWRGLNREDNRPGTAGCPLAVAYCITSKGSSRHEHEAAGSPGQLAAGFQQKPVRSGNLAAGGATVRSGARNKHTRWRTRQRRGDDLGVELHHIVQLVGVGGDHLVHLAQGEGHQACRGHSLQQACRGHSLSILTGHNMQLVSQQQACRGHNFPLTCAHATASAAWRAASLECVA